MSEPSEASERSSEADHITAMRQSDLFRTLTDDELEQVSQLCSPRSHKDGDEVIKEDDRGKEIFIITKGRVDVVISNPLGGGAKQVLDTLGAGRLFGELSLVDGFLRSATVRARGAVEVLVIGDKDLVGLMETEHTIGYKVMRNVSQVLSARIRETNLRLRNALADVLY